MLKTDWNALSEGEQNALVAEKVMGWPIRPINGEPMARSQTTTYRLTTNPIADGFSSWLPSQDRNAAHEVLEGIIAKLDQRGMYPGHLRLNELLLSSSDLCFACLQALEAAEEACV